jgi:chromosome segregation ATPase
MDPHTHEEHIAKLDALKARLDERLATYDPEAEARKHAEHMAEMDRIQASLKQTQAALDPARLKTTVAQVRRWDEEETHPNWIWAAYADLAQRLTRVEDRLDEMADSLRMILGQLAALERQDRDT